MPHNSPRHLVFRSLPGWRRTAAFLLTSIAGWNSASADVTAFGDWTVSIRPSQTGAASAPRNEGSPRGGFIRLAGGRQIDTSPLPPAPPPSDLNALPDTSTDAQPAGIAPAASASPATDVIRTQPASPVDSGDRPAIPTLNEAAIPWPQIIPGPSALSLSPSCDLAARYRAIYDAIPFSRAEYDANPSYRHDATMEILFGQMRPTIIQRGPAPTTNVNVDVNVVPFTRGPAYSLPGSPIFNVPHAPVFYGR